MDWVASTLHTTSEHGVSSITTAVAHTSAASSRLCDAPADLNGLVRFAERRNLVSARVITFQTQSNARYTMFRGSVKGTGYPVHSPVSPSLPLPCLTV